MSDTTYAYSHRAEAVGNIVLAVHERDDAESFTDRHVEAIAQRLVRQHSDGRYHLARPYDLRPASDDEVDLIVDAFGPNPSKRYALAETPTSTLSFYGYIAESDTGFAVDLILGGRRDDLDGTVAQHGWTRDGQFVRRSVA